MNGNNYFLRGNSTSGGTGGESTHVLTIAEMPSHTHTTNVFSPTQTAGTGGFTNTDVTAQAEIVTDATGGGGGHSWGPRREPPSVGLDVNERHELIHLPRR